MKHELGDQIRWLLQSTLDLFLTWLVVFWFCGYVATAGNPRWVTLVGIESRHLLLGWDTLVTGVLFGAWLLVQLVGAESGSTGAQFGRGIIAIALACGAALATLYVPIEWMAGVLPGNLFHAGPCVFLVATTTAAGAVMACLLLGKSVMWLIGRLGYTEPRGVRPAS